MRTLLLALLLSASQLSPAQYVTCSEFGAASLHPAGGTNIAGFSTYTGLGSPPNQWVDVDIMANKHLAKITGIKAVFVQGILMISHGGIGTTANVTLAFRAPGAPGYTCDDYSAQAALVGPGGERQNVGLWVPVTDDKFQMCWTAWDAPGAYYGASLAVNGWCR